MPIQPVPKNNPMIAAIEDYRNRNLDLFQDRFIPKAFMNHYDMAPFEINPNVFMQLQGMRLPPFAKDQEADLPPDPDEQMEKSTYEVARQGAKKLDGLTDEELINALVNGLGQEM